MADDFTPDQKQTLLLATARKRKAEAEGSVAPAPTAGKPDDKKSLWDRMWSARPLVSEATQKKVGEGKGSAFEDMYVGQSKIPLGEGIADVAKSIGSGVVRNSPYALPVVGQAIGGFDLARAAGTMGLNALHGRPVTSDMPQTLAETITEPMGLNYDAKTPVGQAAEVATALGMGSVAPESLLNKGEQAAIKGKQVAGKVGDLAAKGAEKTSAAFRGPEIPLAEKGKEVAQPPTVPKNTQKAARAIAESMVTGQSYTGKSAKESLERLKNARKNGIPLSPADIDPVTRSLARRVMRDPKSVARAFSEAAIRARDNGAPLRFSNMLGTKIASATAEETEKALADNRSAVYGALFDKALNRGTTAPLQQQFEGEFNGASQRVSAASKTVDDLVRKSTLLKAKLATNSDVYVGAETGKELRENEAALAKAEQTLEQAHNDRKLSLEKLRTAQADQNKPGAVWSPHIARITTNPLFKEGMQSGLLTQRTLADARNVPFDPREYWANPETGEVAKVPNLRTLYAGKVGLDNMLAPYFSGEKDFDARFQAIDELRRATVKEIRRLGGKDLNDAMDGWGGESEKIKALNLGEKWNKYKPEQLAHFLSDVPDQMRDFFKIGLVSNLREQLLKTGRTGNEAKMFLNTPIVKERLRPFFKSDKELDDVFDFATNEDAMFTTKQNLLNGSPTAEKLQDYAAPINEGLRWARTAIDAAYGSYFNVFHNLVNLSMTSKTSPEVANEVARMLWDSDYNLEDVEKALPKAMRQHKVAKWAAPVAGGAAYEAYKHTAGEQQK